LSLFYPSGARKKTGILFQPFSLSRFRRNPRGLELKQAGEERGRIFSLMESTSSSFFVETDVDDVKEGEEMMAGLDLMTPIFLASLEGRNARFQA